jgi:hypothetical protein
MNIPKTYIGQRNLVPFNEVALGYRRIILYKIADLDKGQIGYSTDNDGTPLHNWGEKWLVIGYEDEGGDPIFIDTHDETYPVYTALHGQGNWEPKVIAKSFKKFIRTLGYVVKLSEGRRTPEDLKNHPIPQTERNQITNLISKENKGVPSVFWESWLG